MRRIANRPMPQPSAIRNGVGIVVSFGFGAQSDDHADIISNNLRTQVFILRVISGQLRRSTRGPPDASCWPGSGAVVANGQHAKFALRQLSCTAPTPAGCDLGALPKCS